MIKMNNSERNMKLGTEINFQQEYPSSNNTIIKTENLTGELNSGIMNIELEKRLKTESTNIGVILSDTSNNIDKELEEINRMINEGLPIHDDTRNIMSTSGKNLNKLNTERSETIGYNRKTENRRKTNTSFKKNISEKYLEKDYLLIWLADIFLSIHVGLEICPTFQEVRRRASKLEKEFRNQRNKSRSIEPRGINHSEIDTNPTEINNQVNNQLNFINNIRCTWCDHKGHGIINCPQFAIACYEGATDKLRYNDKNGSTNRPNQSDRRNYNDQNFCKQHIPNRRNNQYPSNTDECHNTDKDLSENRNNYVSDNQKMMKVGHIQRIYPPQVLHRFNLHSNHKENSFLEPVGNTLSINTTDQTRVESENPNKTQ